ncbi:MAG: GIY-YIG nuclease family protein, partial [Flavobacteriales bacterium]|nr:GIY-YIG nuclease family protein [Flavobacteriales bacterium]
MFHTYILRSDKSGRYYVGHTQEISLRLVRHNTGQVPSTRGKGPWTLVYEEEYPT